METININGKEYIEKGCGEYNETEHVCIIADRGWIFEGYKRDDGSLGNAHVVRSWSNGLGIGGLADEAYKDDYALDAIGDIRIAPHAIIAEIPLRW